MTARQLNPAPLPRCVPGRTARGEPATQDVELPRPLFPLFFNERPQELFPCLSVFPALLNQSASAPPLLSVVALSLAGLPLSRHSEHCLLPSPCSTYGLTLHGRGTGCLAQHRAGEVCWSGWEGCCRGWGCFRGCKSHAGTHETRNDEASWYGQVSKENMKREVGGRKLDGWGDGTDASCSREMRKLNEKRRRKGVWAAE